MRGGDGALQHPLGCLRALTKRLQNQLQVLHVKACTNSSASATASLTPLPASSKRVNAMAPCCNVLAGPVALLSRPPCSSAYTFPLYAPLLKSRFDLSQGQLEFVASGANVIGSW